MREKGFSDSESRGGINVYAPDELERKFSEAAMKLYG